MVVDLGASGINYVPGDSLGVVPRNFPKAVDELLPHLGSIRRRRWSSRRGPWRPCATC
jgi:sulfite reductase alpha subunit-like flavoprotein